MRDCDNVDVRDLLPELLGDTASTAELTRAREHVAGCEACRAELALLRSVRSAARVPAVDAARIAGAIPAYRRAPAWRSAVQARSFRAAAAILLVAGLGTLMVTDAPRRATPDTALARPAAAGELPTGTPLGDLSEAQLRSLLSELGDLQAVTPTEGDVIVIPSLDRNGV